MLNKKQLPVNHDQQQLANYYFHYLVLSLITKLGIEVLNDGFKRDTFDRINIGSG